MAEILVNQFSGGLTGHIDLTFIDSSGHYDGTYGSNIQDSDQTGLNEGVLREDQYYEAYRPDKSIVAVPVSEEGYQNALHTA